MDKIISVFRPWLDSIPTVDIVSTKLGWVLVEDARIETKAVILQSPDDLIPALAETFLDAAEGNHSRTIAQKAREAMAPYLTQLLPEQTRTADPFFELFAGLDDLAP